jgi:hypothetical protein
MARYLKESQMAPAAVAWLQGEGLLVKQEFTLPWGICDFVGAALDPDRVQKRLALKQRETVGPISRVGVLLSLPDVESETGIGLGELEARFGGLLSEAELRSELAVLTRRKFVRTDGRGLFQKVNGWIPLHKRLVAVELKLDRVDDALCQARKNKEATWESYVGLPIAVAERVHAGKKRMEFEAAGVGILGLGGKKAEVILPARDCGAGQSAVLEVHCVERFWREGLEAVKH